MPYADLELGLHRRDEQIYSVELRFSQPDSEADMRLSSNEILIQLDVEALRAAELDAVAYGQALTAALFTAPEMRTAFAKARATAATLDLPLRLRLLVGPSAPELHLLRWETLRDPESGRALLFEERLLFSRYLASGDWRPIRLRPRADLRALVVIANPADLASYRLAPIDVAGEVARIRQNLGEIEITPLTEPGSVTLNGIAAKLREGYDILYMVAHGAVILGESWLWLENEQNQTLRTQGEDLVARIQEVELRPRLVVLASCQSAGTGDTEVTSKDGGALAALGPRLAEAGIPAVVAMQGNVRMHTVAAFMPVFFRELQKSGVIDHAMTIARGVIRDCDDAWTPILFMRLKSGRIWYVPGFGDDQQSFEKWPALLRNLRRGQCTPVLGSGLLDTVLGSSHEIARRWADTYRYPMEPHERENLPQVAQYLAVNQDPQFPRDELLEYLRLELLRRHSADLPADAQQAKLYDLFVTLSGIQRAKGVPDIYAILAAQPFPIYITAAPDNLLSEALRAVGRDPQVEICRWNEDIEALPSIYDANREPNYQPTAVRPLVYHLFGTINEPDSLVLTEDDYFDFLIGVSLNKDLIPIAVRRAFADTTLLFLGFRLDDWSFRVLFRSIMQQEGSGRRKKYTHVAGQILPEEGKFIEPERARRYLESYFGDADISIFWGSVEDFTRELHERLSA